MKKNILFLWLVLFSGSLFADITEEYRKLNRAYLKAKLALSRSTGSGKSKKIFKNWKNKFRYLDNNIKQNPIEAENLTTKQRNDIDRWRKDLNDLDER